MNKKGQAWVQDAIMSIIIMIIIFSIFLTGYFNISKKNGNFDTVDSDNRIISEYLMLEGTPIDWNETNVLRIGILNEDYSLNETKLEKFYNITITDYDRSREFLNTKSDYIVFFTDDNDTLLNLSNDFFIGKNGINNTNIQDMDFSHIVKTERFLVQRIDDGSNFYKRIIKMNVYSWE